MKNQLFIIILVLSAWTQLISQNIQIDNHMTVEQSIEEAIESGMVFSSCELIKDMALSTKDDKHLMNLGRVELEFIQKKSPSYLKIDLPMEDNQVIELLLVRNDIFADGFSMTDGFGNPMGEEFELGVHYNGVIKGRSSSLVALSVYNNEISGFVKSTEEFWLIRTGVSANGNLESFMFEYNLQDGPESCHTPDDGYVYSEEELRKMISTRAGSTVNIYLEVDFDIYKDKRQGTSNFATGLFNESRTLYSNDGVSIQMSELVIWTSRSPYKGNGASRLLSAFQNHHGSSGSWNGDLAHLIAYRGSGGIAAGFNGLCNGDRRQSMCFSGVDPSYAPVPTYSWSVMVFTHEMGHLLGSRHTHACVWNGNGTAIDGCYTTEGSCTKPGIPENGGTIMSYCHLTSAGINFVNGFGPQPKTVIQNSIAGASCLGGGSGGNHCTNGIQDADETGVDCGGADCPNCPTTSCDVPTGLYANNIKGNRAKLNWDVMSGAISYDVQIRELGGAYNPQNTFNSGSNNLSLRGFTVGTTYEWHVKTNCTGSSSNYSADCSLIAGDKNSGACNSTLVRGSDEYSIYPNPANNEITLGGVPSDGLTNISIYDLSGSIVLARSNISTNSINVSELNRGLYFIQIKTTDRTSSLKFQIQ